MKKNFKELQLELEIVEKLIRQTHDLRQRRLLHVRAWDLLKALQIKATA